MKLQQLNKLKKKIFLIVSLIIIISGLIFFLTAGSFNYWQAWMFLGVLFIPFFFVSHYFLKHDPEFLLRRIKYKEKESEQKLLIKIAYISFFIAYIIPGLDFRYGWSSVPVWLVIASDIIVFSSYMFVFRVFKENSYASRIIEVDKKQKVISTGPYAIVRHPMYAGILPCYTVIPLALGSYIALPFMIPVIIVIILRIFDEEKVLLRDLKGYRDYTKKVKFRLIPGIW